MDQVLAADTSSDLLVRFAATRRRTEDLVRDFEPEDCVVQTMADVSPAKWHLAHTSWFFETFVLAPAVAGYEEFHKQFGYLFNSYYEAVGPRHDRPRRGILTRPTLEEVMDYRDHVDRAMRALFERPIQPEIVDRIELGLNHEQQHQELILTDIKHVLGSQPLEPAVRIPRMGEAAPISAAPEWIAYDGGLVAIGHSGSGFAFDNESPRHEVALPSFQLRSRPVTNREFVAFLEDGGYARPELWLSDGWAAVQREAWTAPMYWKRDGVSFTEYTLGGRRAIRDDDPVRHVSFYEADAFARWADARLPTEQEWEIGATTYAAIRKSAGAVWEWTSSAYAPYPGYEPARGALGEYNGKFMCNQMVLRGGSCATPDGHTRWTYRNFFYPESRWQFSGLRLARS